MRPRANGSLKLVDARGKQVLIAPEPLAVSGSGPLSLAGVGVYRGSLEFRPDGTGASRPSTPSGSTTTSAG